MKTKTDIAVIGAGISGCAAAQELQANGVDYSLLEKNVDPGGLTRSISVGDAHFDYTGHYLHLARYNNPAEIPYAKQDNKKWQITKRKSVVFINETIVPAPLQYNLFALPLEIRNRYIKDYRNRPKTKQTKSLKEYLLSGFGTGMCENFFFPYNTKQMATSIESLSNEGINRFFPNPDDKKIEQGFINDKNKSSSGYNDLFWYPKKQGISLLAKGLSSGLTDLHTCCEVEKIDIKHKLIFSAQGEIKYNRILSSMPLNKLCDITNNSHLKSLSKSLKHNRVLCINLLFNGQFDKKFDKCHWVYVPDPNILFYRLGFYSHFDYSYIAANQSAIYIETAINNETPLPQINHVVNKVLLSLENLKWVNHKNCIVISANWIDCAYIHFNQERERDLNQIFDILQNYAIYPIGRYGTWDYISMEDSIYSSIETAKRLI